MKNKMRMPFQLTTLLLFLVMVITACSPAGKTDSPGEQAGAVSSGGESAALQDGTYVPETFTAQGGTGKVKITCPEVTLTQGEAQAVIEFSSPHYEWVKVNGQQYDPENAQEQDRKNSVFRIPVVLDEEMKISGLTTAMSEPHEIEYTICVIHDADGKAAGKKLNRLLGKTPLYGDFLVCGIAWDDDGVTDAVALTNQQVNLVKNVIFDRIPDEDIRGTVRQILKDRENPAYRENTLFQDKLLWIARSYAKQGVRYAEISDTTLVKKEGAPGMLAQVHAVMPAVTEETGVLLRFLAAIRRIPLTIVKDQVETGDYFRENLETLKTIVADPYVAGSDIIGEELNDIREIAPVLHELVRIAQADPGFVLRIHAGENDGLQDNIANSLECVREALAPGQKMPHVRIGHGLYTPDLRHAKGKALIKELKESGAVLEFQITSNVRLNNLSGMNRHPLRQYLAYGIGCVQGTDGGALYGSDSIDEQLSLEKMLGLTDEEMHSMRLCEDKVLEESLKAFGDKRAAYEKNAAETAEEEAPELSLIGKRSLRASEVLADQICELPLDKSPVVIVGGSFSHANHRVRMTQENKKRIDDLLAEEDPEKIFFVIGHALRGYEQYLVKKNQERFQIFAVVPSMLTEAEYRKLSAAKVKIRVSIEPVPMGTYKSFAYEIFKRRPSRLIAFDGNIAGANMIQEAKNSKYPCVIYVNSRCKALKIKADSLEGYVTLF